MRIEIRSKEKNHGLSTETMAQMVKVLRYVAKEEGVPSYFSVTIGLTDDAHIQGYNRKFRDIDAATDVLSFPMTASKADWAAAKPLLPGLGKVSLGDILISLEHCTAQAKEYGHSFEREFCFLALHGFLHLLGYDHIEEEERREMEALAEQYLTALGVVR